MRSGIARSAAQIALLLLTPCTAAAQAQVTAWVGATLHPVSGAPIEDASLVFRDGHILAVGPRGAVAIPDGADVRDGAGKVIVPGLVDTHSHIGLYPRPLVEGNRDGNETSEPVTPQVRALDAIWPADPGIRMALAGGITTANIMPGSGNVVGGQTAYVKLRGRSVEEMLIRGPDGKSVLGGMKMANGENPKRSHGARDKMPITRMGVAYLERKLFVEAQAYRDEWEAHRAKPQEHPRPERDLRLEPMLEVLDGRRIVHHHTHRADDIATVLRIADEFGHRVVIQHGTEAFKVADLLARKRVPVSAIIVESPGGKHEAIELGLEGPGILERAGVQVALHTDDFVTHSRLLLRSAALAIRGGMSEEGALAALTANAAAMLDLGERIGTLEPGKDADFAVLSGPPFAVRTLVLETWIEGEKIWDRADPLDRLYQTGGFQVAERYPRRAEPGQ